ncbi:MAG: TRAP transporter small permease subunit [Deltaproteobacteria bacterium]|nr:TRAP transporter small permease subunit [Deltaproteobacteria bacterium]MBT6501617.1 TRAP transporter small permease subunit [Deltaproteobacteria bacterium]
MVEVIRRYIFNSPTVWGNELTQMMFGVYVVLPAGYILVSGGHVNVDILSSRLSPQKQALLDIISSFLFFIFTGFLVFYGSSLAWESVSMLETSQTAWDVPIYPIKLMIPLGAVLLLIQGIAKLIRDIVLFITGEDISVQTLQQKETL